MKTITIDEELYAHIASQTKYIGESASDILRRLLMPETEQPVNEIEAPQDNASAEESPQVVIESNDSALALDENALLACSTVVERFLLVLSWLHDANKDSFSKVLNIKGKGRDYFAVSKEHLLATGSSTNPKAIPNTDYWVVSNNNTSKKASILRLVSEVLGYDDDKQSEVAKTLTLK